LDIRKKKEPSVPDPSNTEKGEGIIGRIEETLITIQNKTETSK